jgi:hypothetical protein
LVFLVVSFLLAFPPISYMHSSSPLFVSKYYPQHLVLKHCHCYRKGKKIWLFTLCYSWITFCSYVNYLNTSLFFLRALSRMTLTFSYLRALKASMKIWI